MSKIFSSIILAISATMLYFQFVVTEEPKIAVGALWILIAIICIYTIFFKRTKPNK